MAPCSSPGQPQGREWWVSPRRLLSIGQPRTANPAGEHDTSAKKASLPGHCTCKRLRGPPEDRKKVPPPGDPRLQFDCPSCLRRSKKLREGPSFHETVDRALDNPPSLYGGCGHSHHAEPEPSSSGAGCGESPAMVRRTDDTDDSTGSALLHLGKKGLGSAPSIFWPIRRHFLGAPECRQSPPTGGGATAVALHGTTHPRPSTKGGCGHRLCATWAAPRDGSNRRRASARCLAPHAPPFGRLRHKAGSCPPPQSEVHPE